MAIDTSGDAQGITYSQVTTVGNLVVGRCLVKTGSTVLTSASNAISMDCSLSDNFTNTPTETTSITAVNMQPGQIIRILFTTAGTSSFTTTFGTGMHSTGTLASGTTSARFFVVVFVADATGTALYEVSRTTAQA